MILLLRTGLRYIECVVGYSTYTGWVLSPLPLGYSPPPSPSTPPPPPPQKVKSCRKPCSVIYYTGADNDVSVFSITHHLHNGKQGLIDFSTGMKYVVTKGKNGHLTVVSRASSSSCFISSGTMFSLCRPPQEPDRVLHSELIVLYATTILLGT